MDTIRFPAGPPEPGGRSPGDRSPGAAGDPILDPLNDAQRQAVTHTGGPLLVLAGAGSGKTRVITHRIAYLARSGFLPENLLAITFTNKAAGEMRERIEKLLGVRTPWISTFHSFAARLLRRHIYRLPPFDGSFTIYDADDSLGLIKECIRSLDVATAVVSPRSVQEEISRLKNRGIEDPEALPGSTSLKDQVIHKVLARYIKLLAERNALDFDDLLLLLVRLLRTQPDLLDRYRGQFQHVLIDEYQDTNTIQYQIGRLLAEAHRNLCVTGDPDQSIYSWRGADLRNILCFERDFPDARIVKLEQNYRSTPSILRAANAVIRHNLDRKEKNLWTENPEGEPVRVHRFLSGEEEAAEIAELLDQFRGEGTPGDHIAIFYRVNALSREIERALLFRGIPYVIVGAVEFYQRREVKDLVSYLRLLLNPRDTESLRRVINVPPRRIGKTSIERLLEAAGAAGIAPLEAVLDPARRPPEIRRRTSQGVDAFAAIYRELAALPRSPVAPLLEGVIERLQYDRYLREGEGEEYAERAANVAELVNAAAQYDRRQPGGELEGFLEEVALLAAVDRWEHREDRVSLMTFHSAKGLEFPIVILTAVEDGLLPLVRQDGQGRTDVEEERRLFYVGITRAREKLYITHAGARLRFGALLPCRPSKFLGELSEAEESGLRIDPETRSALTLRSSLIWEFEDEAVKPRRASGRAAAAEEVDWDAEAMDEDPYPPGTRVMHETYGAGVVIGSSGAGHRRRLTIDFENAGEKRIVPGFARLRRL